MEYWWKENKRFALIVGGIAVGLAIYWKLVLSSFGDSADKLRRELEFETKNYTFLSQHGVPAEDTIRRAQDDESRLRKQLDDLGGDIGFKDSKDFTPEPADRVGEQWENIKLEKLKALRDDAGPHGCVFPDNLGWGAVGESKPPPARCAELIRRLAIVDRACRLAFDARISKIVSIDMTRGIEENQSRDSSIEAGKFLNKLDVLIKFEGSSECVFRFLYELQKPGQYLYADSFAVSRNAGQDYFSGEIVVSGMLIDPKGAIEVRKETP